MDNASSKLPRKTTRGRSRNQTELSEQEYQDELQSKFDYYAKQYPDVNNENKRNLRSQMFLMVKWETGEEAVKMLMEQCTQLQDVDFFRCLLLMVNDLEFIKSELIGKEFCYEDATDLALQHAFKKKYPTAKRVDELTKEKEQLKEQYKLQMEFLVKELDFEKKLSEMENQHHHELRDKEKEMADQKIKFEKEINEKALLDANERIRQYESERETLTGKIAAYERRIDGLLRELAAADGERNTASPPSDRAPEGALDHEPQKGEEASLSLLRRLNFRFRSRREHDNDKNQLQPPKDRKFIITLLKNTEYTKEQLNLLLFAHDAGIPIRDIEQFMNPELPYANMWMLCKMFMNNHGIKGSPPMEASEVMPAGMLQPSILQPPEEPQEDEPYPEEMDQGDFTEDYDIDEEELQY